MKGRKNKSQETRIELHQCTEKRIAHRGTVTTSLEFFDTCSHLKVLMSNDIQGIYINEFIGLKVIFDDAPHVQPMGSY